MPQPLDERSFGTVAALQDLVPGLFVTLFPIGQAVGLRLKVIRNHEEAGGLLVRLCGHLDPLHS
jgi:hypothetical protein